MRRSTAHRPSYCITAFSTAFDICRAESRPSKLLLEYPSSFLHGFLLDIFFINTASYDTLMMASKFIPRQIFPHQASLPRSYYLGHHKAGLEKMKSMISSVDYVVECRDFRLPLTSINPVFEQALGGKKRLIVYTKLDLCTVPSDEKRTVSLPDSTFD